MINGGNYIWLITEIGREMPIFLKTLRLNKFVIPMNAMPFND